MISADDVLGLPDRLLRWLPGALDWLSDDARAYLMVPMVVAVLLAIPWITVRRVLPWIVRHLVTPAVAVLAGVVAGAALIVDFVAARIFRLFWLPLTGAHYAFGDWAVGGARTVRDTGRYRLFQAGGWLGRFRRLPLVLIGVVLVVLWSRGYCTRNPAIGCAEPIDQWWDRVLAAVSDIDLPWK
jgi:hypothetical protein